LRRPLILSSLIVLVCAACANPAGRVELAADPPLGEGNVLLNDVGLMLPKAGFQTIIAAGCEMPCKGSFIARTSLDDQDRLQIVLMRRPVDRRALVTRAGAFQIDEIPPGPAGQRAIDVTIRAKRNQISVFASDQETGESLPLRTVLMMAD